MLQRLLKNKENISISLKQHLMMCARNYRFIALAKRLCCQANISCFVPADYLIQNCTKKTIKRIILYLEHKEGQVVCDFKIGFLHIYAKILVETA